MKQKQFKCSESNFIFVELSTFKTHMQRQYCLALGKHRITLLSIFVDGANHVKQKQFKCNECNFIAKLNTFDTHMKRGLCLALGRNRWELLLFGQLCGRSHPHEEKRFRYNECNFTFIKLTSLNTHMEKQHCLALHKNKITLFWSTV